MHVEVLNHVSLVKRNVALLLLYASEMRRHVTSEMCFTVNILQLDFCFENTLFTDGSEFGNTDFLPSP